MTSFSENVFTRQDVVLVDFLFSEETGSKRRPVLVLLRFALIAEHHEQPGENGNPP